MTLTFSLLFAAVLALINLWLAVRIIAVRRAAKVGVGDGEHPLLRARMRAQANFAENVPIALILMALVELRVGGSLWLFALGLLLVIARLLHPFGMERRNTKNALRGAGAALSWLVVLALIGWAIALLLAPAPPPPGTPTFIG